MATGVRAQSRRQPAPNEYRPSFAVACGLQSDGVASCCGDNQLGNGTFSQSSVPVRVIAPVRFASADAGGYFGCGIGVDGFTYCWGNNRNGELAGGTTADRSSAARVVPPEL